MEKITYGTPLLLDWVAQIKAGSATLRVHFTGGTLTAYGITPAEYTTDDPFIQKVIEKSSYFKDGRIVELRRTGSPAPRKPKATKPADEPIPVESVQPSEEEQLMPDEGTVIEVSCLQDAQAFLQEQYNIPSYKVRTCESAQKVAAEHGVTFVGGKFNSLNEEISEEE